MKVLELMTALFFVCGATACGGGSDSSPDDGEAMTPDGAIPPNTAPGTAISIMTFSDPALMGPTSNTMVVAFQDGAGAWSALTSDGGTYHATVSGTIYGVAVACATHFSTGTLVSNTTLYYRSVADPTELRGNGCLHDLRWRAMRSAGSA